MPGLTKERGKGTRRGRSASRSKPGARKEFPPGPPEAALSAIGSALPAKEWAKIPKDYFANLDFYLHGAPKNK